MFIRTADVFKIGIGPSSSHTMGPMVAAARFLSELEKTPLPADGRLAIRCTLKGSLAYTGKGHGSDKAVILGLHNFRPEDLAEEDVDKLLGSLSNLKSLRWRDLDFAFDAEQDIVFDYGPAFVEHPNGIVFECLEGERALYEAIYFSVGGGFVMSKQELAEDEIPLVLPDSPYPFDSAKLMLQMAKESRLSISAMKRANEEKAGEDIDKVLDDTWDAMKRCLERGLKAEGTLPGGLNVERRAKALYECCQQDANCSLNEWLCAYAMAVNEENAAGHLVVTAPTNGAAGVIPALIYFGIEHLNFTREQIHTFLLTAAAIGGLIKHRSSISGAEVGCQGEVGSASAMGAAGLCAVMGGSPLQIEHAAEIALEHHMGMTCDPVNGLVQIPCIERNGFGAIKAHTAARLAMRGTGQHKMPFDNCIEAMRQTGEEMSTKYKETSLGGLAVNMTEC